MSPALASVTRNDGTTSAARSTKSCTASDPARDSGVGGPSWAGSDSGGTSQAVSPGIDNASRLVASTSSRPHLPSRAATRPAALLTTCSQLSRTRRTRRSAMRFAMASCPAAPRRLRTPSTSATCSTTSSSSWIGASSTQCRPSGYSSARWLASSCARRVFPDPPEPVRVTRRVVPIRRPRLAISLSRPMKRVRGGRVGAGAPPVLGGSACLVGRSGIRARQGRLLLPGRGFAWSVRNATRSVEHAATLDPGSP